jgi:hypothetical protein
MYVLYPYVGVLISGIAVVLYDFVRCDRQDRMRLERHLDP